MNAVEYALRVAAVLGGGFALTAALRRQSAALRHLVWASTFVVACAAPLLSTFGPEFHWKTRAIPAAALDLPSPQAVAVAADSSSQTPPLPRQVVPAIPASPTPDAIPWIAILWALGTLVCLIRLARSVFQARALLRGSIPIQIEGYDSPLPIAESAAIGAPMVVGPLFGAGSGAASARILLPTSHREWGADRLRAVMLHECAHARRGDHRTQWLPNLVCALHWFNPIAWLARSEMLYEAERACDDAALGGGMGGGEFARHLVEIAQAIRNANTSDTKGSPLMNTSLTTKLERRVKRLLDARADRRALTGRRAAVAALSAVALLAPIAAVRASAVSSPTTPVAQPAPTSAPAVLPAPSAPLANAPVVLEAPRRKPPVLLAQAAPTPQAASDQTGSLSGTVIDPTGAVVANATVRVQPSGASAQGATDGPGGRGSTPATLSTTASPVGKWTFTSLPVGTYSLSVQVPGFVAFNRTVAVNAGPNVADARLIVGKITESVTISAKRPNASPQAQPQAAPQRIRVGGNIQAASLIKRVNPTYPASAQEKGIEGSVTFQAIIDKSGFLRDSPLVATSGPAELVQAALDAVKLWQYKPALLNGEPIEVQTEITVNFQLAN